MDWSSEIESEVTQDVTRINWLVELPIAGGLYLASRHEVEHDGNIYAEAAVDVLQTEGSAIMSVRIRNPGAQYTPEVANGDWRGAPAAVLVESDGVVDDYFIGEAVAAPVVGHWIEFTLAVPSYRTARTPRERISRETGFNHLIAPGRVVEWDGERYELRPRER